MKLKWDDIRDIFESAGIWENGHDMYWYRLMWGLMDYRGLNVYDSEEDVKYVFSKAFAIISIYHEFINICFDGDEDITEYFSSGDNVYSIMRYLYSEKDIKDIFRALNEELGLVRTFYSIFITCVEFRDGKISYTNDNDEYEDFAGGLFSALAPEYGINYDFDSEEIRETDDFYEDSLSDNETDDYPENPSEDYYNSFETYLNVLAASSMSILRDCSPEKLAGYIYLSRNMNRSGAV
ncbi:hypothetical protein [Ruminococcus sp. HUN007]|uniref:hypothetical protein n=1 Tax=Ruminococcus sp. HUN007 TaxID=1514668 RepID=UPI0005D19734|nr:hypothetical protein [Ruminococcus sp. HUN007]